MMFSADFFRTGPVILSEILGYLHLADIGLLDDWILESRLVQLQTSGVSVDGIEAVAMVDGSERVAPNRIVLDRNLIASACPTVDNIKRF